MARYFPKDILLLARLLAAVGAVAWLALGGPAITPLVVAALVLLLATCALIWRDDVVRGKTVSLSAAPRYVVVGDLLASGVWMAATAPNERSIAFVVVLAIGSLAMFRLGRAGVALTGAVYIVARVAQEYIRVTLGIPYIISSRCACWDRARYLRVLSRDHGDAGRTQKRRWHGRAREDGQ